MHDHAPLKAANLAAERDGGHVVTLFIFEPDIPVSTFLTDSLRDLEDALDQRGAALHYRHGEAIAVLSDLHRDHNILSLYVHETTRPLSDDHAIEAWCLRAGIALRAFPQFGPDRTTGRADTGQGAWDAFMAAPRHEAPADLSAADVGVGQRPTASAPPDDLETDLPGGRKAAIKTLKRVLGPVSDLGQVAAPAERAPLSHFERLAPYLEAGLVSIREAWQAAVTARNQYLAAGQDIRAAQVTDLIRHLPVFYRTRYGERSHTFAPHRRSGPGEDKQLSLDLDPTGTG